MEGSAHLTTILTMGGRRVMVRWNSEAQCWFPSPPIPEKCAMDGWEGLHKESTKIICNRPPSGDSAYCWSHKYDGAKLDSLAGWWKEWGDEVKIAKAKADADRANPTTRCNGCEDLKPKSEFSKSQLKTKADIRRCKDCIETENILIRRRASERLVAAKAYVREQRSKNWARHRKEWKIRESILRSIANRVFSNIDEFRIDLNDGTLSFSVGGRSLRYNDVLTRSNKSIEEEMKEDKNRRPTPRCSVRRCIWPARRDGMCYSHWDATHGDS